MSSFEEARRSIEQELKTISLGIERTRLSGIDAAAQAALKRVKGSLDKLRRIPGGDSVVVNRLTAEVAQLENELKRAEKTWLLSNNNNNQNNSMTAPLLQQQQQQQRTEDEDRAVLLRSNEVLGQTDQLVQDIESNVRNSHTIGVNTINTMHMQGQDLDRVRRNVTDTGVTAKNAATVLRRMAERAFYNRVFLWFVIFCFFLADVLFLYFGFIKNNN